MQQKKQAHKVTSYSPTLKFHIILNVKGANKHTKNKQNNNIKGKKIKLNKTNTPLV